MITTDSLWYVVACDLAHLYPFFCKHLVKHNKEHSSSNIDCLFKNIIKTLLYSLGNVLCKELPVIVIDALDECGGLRYDSSAKDDYKDLLYTLKCWIQANHLKKFKLVIISWLEDAITKMFSKSVSTHVNISFSSNIKLEDSTFDDIYAFLKLQFDQG